MVNCRAVNVALLDTYQLKSLDAVFEDSLEKDSLKLVKVGNRLKFELLVTEGDENPDNMPLRDLYDKVIVCFGFQFDSSIFNR